MPAARVLLVTDDLLFGSKVESLIRAAGGEPLTVASPSAALATIERDGAELIVVDLVSDGFDGLSLPAGTDVPALGYYAHTDEDTPPAARAAGFKQVVPRSRMAREGDQLIRRLLAGD